jgi:hypothetical protein
MGIPGNDKLPREGLYEGSPDSVNQKKILALVSSP